MAKNERRRFGPERKREMESSIKHNIQRLEKIESYLGKFNEKIDKVSEDNDNLRFLVSVIRAQEKNQMQMNNHIQQQQSLTSMYSEFIANHELTEEFNKYVQEKVKEENAVKEEKEKEKKEGDEE